MGGWAKVTSAMASCAPMSLVPGRLVSSRLLLCDCTLPIQREAAYTLTVTLSIRFISHAFSQVVDLSPSCFFVPPLLAVLLAGERPFICNYCRVV